MDVITKVLIPPIWIYKIKMHPAWTRPGVIATWIVKYAGQEVLIEFWYTGDYHFCCSGGGPLESYRDLSIVLKRLQELFESDILNVALNDPIWIL